MYTFVLWKGRAEKGWHGRTNFGRGLRVVVLHLVVGGYLACRPWACGFWVLEGGYQGRGGGYWVYLA